jgi:hypothetical protein
MTILMYDAINSQAMTIRRLRKPGDLAAYYIAGDTYIWTPEERALFPPDALVSITLTASYLDADVLDRERGGAAVDEVAGWTHEKRAAGYERPTTYCSLADVPAIREATGALRLGIDYDLWVADWDGSQALPPGVPLAAAKQYRDAGAYDVSVVYDAGWPHRKAPSPGSPPSPPVATWPAGVVLRPGSSGAAVRVLQAALAGTGMVGVRGIAVDGQFGSQTETSLRNYQRDKGLAVDGVAGNATRKALGV